MKTAIVFAFVAVAIDAALVLHTENFDKVLSITKQCAIEHQISDETLNEFGVAQDKSAFEASEELKCFAKCAVQRSKSMVVTNGKVYEQRLVELGASNGKSKESVRANFERCRPLYKGSSDCNEYWQLYICASNAIEYARE